jgi:hypothetical protein
MRQGQTHRQIIEVRRVGPVKGKRVLQLDESPVQRHSYSHRDIGECNLIVQSDKMASAFSPEQIATFLHIIQLPEKFLPKNNPPLDYAFLEALHIHMISTIPYENLSLHYSTTRKISIQPEDALAKFSTGRGRGGYCMENSIFFNHILRGLGFTAYTAGVRIRLREEGVPSGPFTGW